MMRHWIAVASLAAALAIATSAPALARTTMHGGDRFILIADTRFDNRSVLGERFPRRFAAMPRHRFDRFDRFDRFGDWDWGPDGWADGADFANAEPPVAEVGTQQIPTPRSPAELPRCHEVTSAGVVIERRSGCVH